MSMSQSRTWPDEIESGAPSPRRLFRRAVWTAVAFAMCLSLSSLANALEAHTNPLNHDPLVREAYDRFYQLDYPGAVSRFERFHALHPGDPQGTALLLNAVLFQELYRLDLLDTSFYSNDGFAIGKRPNDQDPKVRDRIYALTDEAVHESDWRLAQNAKDIDALYARGWARSLKATYLALVERGFAAGLKLSIEAKNDHAKVLAMDPGYSDAKLVSGVYEYVVGSLPLPFRLLVSAAGFTGSKAKGMELLRDAADHGAITSVEARTTMALFLRREHQYREAAQVVASLKNQYPHDFLFCLEDANLRRESGEGAGAVAAYRTVIEQTERPGYFPSAHVNLAWFGLGESLFGQQDFRQAAEAYEQAARTPSAGAELKRRSLVAAGMSHDRTGERPLAIADYQAAIRIGADSEQAGIARRYLASPYRAE